MTVVFLERDFNPDEPRDDHGQWTSGGSSDALQSSDFAGVGKNSIAEDSMETMSFLITSGKNDAVTEQDAVEAKAAVQEQLSTGLKDNADWQKYVQLTQHVSDGGSLEVDHLVKRWASTSSDTEPESLLLQAMVAEEFGITDHRNAGLQAANPTYVETNALADRVVLYRDQGGYRAPETLPEARETVKAGYRAFAREMYAQTQDDLAAHGIKSVYLARGVLEDHPSAVTDMRMHPMSSFSTDYAKAYQFSGGAMIFAKVPASRIISTPRTGFGCLNEREVVVLGGVMKVVTTPRGLVRADWTNTVADILKPKKAAASKDVLEVDGTLLNADWTKTTWDLPPYKSPEFMVLVNDLDAIKKLPVYLHAVRTGVIVNDEWV